MLLHSLDELLAESERLRLEISASMMRRASQQFWPDRRRISLAHDPDRRRPQPYRRAAVSCVGD
jgi:hypothetical protein